jgi:hypothetical protein
MKAEKSDRNVAIDRTIFHPIRKRIGKGLDLLAS